MKLLQILYPGLGGHSSVATSLIAGDRENKFNHYLLGYGIEKPSGNLAAHQCDYILKKQGFDWMSYLKVFKKIRKLKPDAVIVHSTSQVITVFVYSLFHNIKWLAVEHQANNAKTKMDWVYSFLILLLAPKVVYLTEMYKKEMTAHFPRLTKFKKIAVIGNGIDLNKFMPGTRVPDGFSNITMISRMNRLRDHHTLVMAFCAVAKNNARVRLKLAGDGETYDEIKKLIHSLGIENKVELLGFLHEDEIIDLLHNTDIYVHSSLAETQSTSLLQVMACKIPIIATDIDGITNLLTNNLDAVLFPVSNSELLETSLNAMLSSPEMRYSLIENAYKKVTDQFNNIVLFKRYHAFLNNSSEMAYENTTRYQRLGLRRR